MNNRSRRISAAIRSAKKRDGYTCQSCGARGAVVMLDGAHLLPRNVALVRYDPADADNIITLCRVCHADYDRNKTLADRVRWLRSRALAEYADRLLWLYGEV